MKGSSRTPLRTAAGSARCLPPLSRLLGQPGAFPAASGAPAISRAAADLPSATLRKVVHDGAGGSGRGVRWPRPRAPRQPGLDARARRCPDASPPSRPALNTSRKCSASSG